MSLLCAAAPERLRLALEPFDMPNRRRSRLKLVLWDGNGVWLAQRRLHRGSFTWPQAGDLVFPLTTAQWRWLIAGVDWQRCAPPAPTHWQV